ncbi:MAG: hypothetical protein ABWZ79_04010 [Pedobacter agri]
MNYDLINQFLLGKLVKILLDTNVSVVGILEFFSKDYLLLRSSTDKLPLIILSPFKRISMIVSKEAEEPSEDPQSSTRLVQVRPQIKSKFSQATEMLTTDHANPIPINYDFPSSSGHAFPNSSRDQDSGCDDPRLSNLQRIWMQTR